MPQSTINLTQTTKRPLLEVIVIELAQVPDTHVIYLDLFELKWTLEIWLHEISFPWVYPNFTYNRLILGSIHRLYN